MSKREIINYLFILLVPMLIYFNSIRRIKKLTKKNDYEISEKVKKHNKEMYDYMLYLKFKNAKLTDKLNVTKIMLNNKIEENTMINAKFIDFLRRHR